MGLTVSVCTGKVRRVFLMLRNKVPRASYQEGIASLRMSWRTIAAWLPKTALACFGFRIAA